MPKPEWLKNQESKPVTKFKMCITCGAGGDLCGYTKNTGHGKMPMYRCREHPSVVFYRETFACEHWHARQVV